jgi:SAM-dependent methyltransferase
MHAVERLLLSFARPVEAEDLTAAGDRRAECSPLAILDRECPEFRKWIADADVLDFGCGRGLQAIAMALAGARRVVGVELARQLVAMARENAERAGVADRVRFTSVLDGDEVFDLVVSQNAMEHYRNPAAVLGAMARAVRPEGRLLITFGPPWFAPFGHHMHYFLPLPWLNLWCPESIVMRLRSRYRQDGATRYEDVEGGLNRMTLGKFERLIHSLQWPVEYRRYTAVKGLPLATRVPIIRELLTNHVTAVLRRP